MKNKKIGGVVVTNFNHTNYGTFLQAYATLKTIQDLGYDLTFIRYVKTRSIWKTIRILPLYLLSGGFYQLKVVLKNKICEKIHPEYLKNQKIRIASTNLLKQQEFMPYLKEYCGYEALCKGSKEYDAVFVGSDQTWRPIGFYSNYWNLNFVDDNIPKFSYASSFGVSSIPQIQKKGTSRYLNRFNLISVREQKAKEIVESLSDKTAQVVADPTMLRTALQWREFASSSKMIISEPYIFCYFLGTRTDIREEAKKIAELKRMKIVTMRHMDEYIVEDDKFGDFYPYNVDARDFITLLMNAEYVCTDSFHGTVFSILMHKKFKTFYRTRPTSGVSTHSRIDSLLSIFSLNERLYTNDILSIDDEIDFEEIDGKLEIYRRKSLRFLEDALNLANNRDD